MKVVVRVEGYLVGESSTSTTRVLLLELEAVAVGGLLTGTSTLGLEHVGTVALLYLKRVVW